jgi:hypothetical protein
MRAPPLMTDDRVAGMALAAISLLSVVAMAHHPTGTGHPGLARIVHGALIVFVLVAFAGYIRLLLRLGLDRFANLAALVAYGMGAIANVFAAVINGFVVGALVSHDASADVMRLCRELNQALAFGAVYATAFAFLVWSLALVRQKGFARLVGLVGLAASCAPAALLASAAVTMNVAGAFVIYLLQAVFGILAGALLAVQRSDND